MDSTSITAEAVELLSRVTGQSLRREDLSPSVVFLATLITVLQGVMLQDGQITDEEKQQWQKTVTRFIPPNGNMRQLVQLMSKGIRQHRIYASSKNISVLANPLSESECLLVIGLAYEMSASDGHIASNEQKYLRSISNCLNLNAQYLPILEAGLKGEEITEIDLLRKIQFLLEPIHFHELDNVFIKAASDILSLLPKNHYEIQSIHKIVNYENLNQFQFVRSELQRLFYQILQMVQEGEQRSLLPSNFRKEIEEKFNDLSREKFRISVLGEFSKGKSTLLNALLGEEIQPVREIPCSGQITVLRYGEQRRVTCRHKNGDIEEISFEEYKEKASISESAALGNLDDELSSSSIEEIILEDPNLTLCRNGIEILDSPGLNEHPERTQITNRLLKDIDAVIFLTSAFQPLNQGERELLLSLKYYLNPDGGNLSTDKAFVLVNFWDSITTEKGRQQIQKRIFNLLQGSSPIIQGNNRIHFISAKEALNAYLTGKDSEYLVEFNKFKDSLQEFLVYERGFPKIKNHQSKVIILIQEILSYFLQAELSLDGKLQLSEIEERRIIEKIGEASGRDIRIQILSDQILDRIIEETNSSWNEWVETLDEVMTKKLENWSSKHSPLFSRDQLVKDYVNQFNRDLSQELEKWIDSQLKNEILNKHLKDLEEFIRQELKAIEHDFNNISKLHNDSSNWTFLAEQNELLKQSSLAENIGLAGLGAAVLVPAFIFAGPILFIIGSLVGGGFLGMGAGGLLGLDKEIRAKVYEIGSEKFIESLDNIFDKISETINSAVSLRVQQADETISRAILFCENLLEQQERAHSETLEKREADKKWISLKSEELKQIQKEIDLLVDKYEAGPS